MGIKLGYKQQKKYDLVTQKNENLKKEIKGPYNPTYY